MSKYVYYNGKIKEVIEYETGIGVVSNIGSITYYPKQEFYKIYSDAKMFDNFEDLIEIGDLIKIYVEDKNYKKVEYFGMIDEFGLIGPYSIGFHSKRFLEIWKRIGNTFVRVCHKENNEWVID